VLILLLVSFITVMCHVDYLYFTDSFVFHCVFITVCAYWCIDLFSCTAARVSIKLIYLLTYLLGAGPHSPIALVGQPFSTWRLHVA